MNSRKPKRFWQNAHVGESNGGFAILLDQKPIQTPGKLPLQVPTPELAGAIAAEWDAQEEIVSPETMPLTRLANSAIDKVTPQKDEVADLLAAYADADLLCYRAAAPAALKERQSAEWDPYISWAANELGSHLELREGVVHSPQSEETQNRLSGHVRALDPFKLTAFHDLVTLTGSLILAFATIRNFRVPEQIWCASQLDENWQIEQWGEDEIEKMLAQSKRQAFMDAARFFDLL